LYCGIMVGIGNRCGLERNEGCCLWGQVSVGMSYGRYPCGSCSSLTSLMADTKPRRATTILKLPTWYGPTGKLQVYFPTESNEQCLSDVGLMEAHISGSAGYVSSTDIHVLPLGRHQHHWVLVAIVKSRMSRTPHMGGFNVPRLPLKPNSGSDTYTARRA